MSVSAFVERGIRERIFPGVAWAYGRSGEVVRGFSGSLTYEPGSPVVDDATVWDLASLTKVVCTTSLAMILVERGELCLDMPVAEVLPAFGAQGKSSITVRHLLSHNSGLAATGAFAGRGLNREQILAEIDEAPLSYETDAQSVYSDLGFITLGRVVEAAAGDALDQLFEQEVGRPLGLKFAGFRPVDRPQGDAVAFAPTSLAEPWRIGFAEGEPIRGVVHDPTAWSMGGVAGHAGLFSNLEDMVTFANAIANGSGPFGTDIVLAFSERTGNAESRALGWDTNWRFEASCGDQWPEDSFGHTGFTGTAIWLHLPSQTFAVLLTNRVHPTQEGDGIRSFRREFHTEIAARLCL